VENRRRSVGEVKEAGRVRYIGVTAAFPNQHAQLEAIMRSEPIDFVSVDYAIDNRAVEQTLLPLARARKIAVMANFPFGGNSGPNNTIVNRLFKRTANTPLPAWAAEFDVKSWGQFFLKYVISNPAINAVRAGTEKPHHMLDNIGGGVGRLPNDAMRKRMVQFIDALPEVVDSATVAPPSMAIPTAILDRYVGAYTATGILLTFRREGERLVLRPGADSEIVLVTRSEIRFTTGPIAIEFQVDGQGKVTGAILEEGPRRTTLERK
jgi:hypothetical protein